MRQYTLVASAMIISLVATTHGAFAQQTDMAKIMTAAPAAVVKDATIVQMLSDGTMKTVKAGTNQFTCAVLPSGNDGVPMCADKNAMRWMGAYMMHSAPPDETGFIYMLAGDGAGTSNTDPYATKPSAANHWVKTGPHVMIVGPSVKNMGYPASADPDTTKPYVMWAGTPYAHLMIPVSTATP